MSIATGSVCGDRKRIVWCKTFGSEPNSCRLKPWRRQTLGWGYLYCRKASATEWHSPTWLYRENYVQDTERNETKMRVSVETSGSLLWTIRTRQQEKSWRPQKLSRLHMKSNRIWPFRQSHVQRKVPSPPPTQQAVDCVLNVTAYAQKPNFVFRRNGRFHFNQRGASVQSNTGSRGVRISGSNAVYTMFRGSVKSAGYPLHS